MSRTIIGTGDDQPTKTRGYNTRAVSDTSASHVIYQTSHTDRMCVQAVWTGTVAGTITVEVSNSYIPSNDGGIDSTPIRTGVWTDISSTLTIPSVTSPGGGTSSGMIQLGFRDEAFVRITFTPSAGAGNFDTYLNDKAYA
jgi:hypothetical protein